MRLRKWKRRLKHLLLRLSLLLPADSAYADLEYVYYQPVWHEITVELPVSLSGEDIDEIMSKALCGGILRWCKEATAQGQYPGKLVSEQLSRNGTLLLRDNANTVHELTLQKLLNGFRQYLIAGGNVDRNERGQIDIRDIHYEASDAIIQYALFGKIIHEYPKRGGF